MELRYTILIIGLLVLFTLAYGYFEKQRICMDILIWAEKGGELNREDYEYYTEYCDLGEMGFDRKESRMRTLPVRRFDSALVH